MLVVTAFLLAMWGIRSLVERGGGGKRVEDGEGERRSLAESGVARSLAAVETHDKEAHVRLGSERTR